MPITLGLNLSSLRAQSQLGRSSSQLSSVFERLSSGQRINRASDDAAGLAIAESLNSDARVFTQGIRNLNDGLSVLNVADGALNELTNITIRLAELAEQSANGVLGKQQRAALDEEAQALSDEYFRIVQSTEFNGRQLFAADYGELRLQAGFGLEGSIAEGLGGAIGDGTFADALTHTTGSGRTVQSADFNGDGIADLATVSSTADTLTIALGNGDGTFANVFTGAGGNGLSDLSVGDLNNDGIVDIAATNLNDGSISIFIGNGDGTFGDISIVDVNAVAPNSISLADFDGDGNLDIVTSDFAGATPSVLYGTGTGSFIESTQLLFDPNWRIDTGDFNGDGFDDFATIDSLGDNITLFLSNGDRTFSSGGSYASGPNPLGILVADFNGDGRDDVATGNRDDDTVAVLLAQEDGSLAAVGLFDVGDNPRALEAGDFNGDGILDIVTANYSDNTASFLLGNGDGTFQAASSFNVGSTPDDIALGDFNNDGVLDFVTGEAGSLSVLLSNTVDGVSPLLEFSLNSIADAKQALSQFTQKIDQLSEQRGQIGAFQARLQVAENVLQVTTENYRAAESRIRDADIAQEAADLVRLQILQQAGASVLGQANLQPQLVLQLLGGGR